MTPIISTQKLTDYLLNIQHADGGPKAKFFLGHGYKLERPEQLAETLMAHACDANFRHLALRSRGTHAIFEGPITTPNGTTPTIRSVWQKLSPIPWLLLITAYPLN